MESPEEDAASAQVCLDPCCGQKEEEDGGSYLYKFRLYKTRSKFYMIGRNKARTQWRVLKIDRSEPSELNIFEDTTPYSESECQCLLKRLGEGNRSAGGLQFVTDCYGIVGFIKFLGPYYMLLITKRMQIGSICGHAVYSIAKSEMIPLQNPSSGSNLINSRNENRYKKLLSTVDLTKDFYFSHSYHVMCSLQKNLQYSEGGQVLYETMFVWNEFLTRGIRGLLKNTLWIVALVYGFFKQTKLSISGKEFMLTLLARRSRHFAGTRYLKRGVNEKGRVANDVETEQIVFEEILGKIPTQITSVVQNRGSIPLFWSQETSRLNLKPDIILQKKDKNYDATRLHFENLVIRYGNPIIILNLIKTREKKPRESILRREFSSAIDFINRNLSEENRLRFLHWDLNKHSRSKATIVLALLGKVATYALNLTGFFYCQVPPALRLNEVLDWSILMKNNGDDDVFSNANIKFNVEDEVDVSTNVSNIEENNNAPASCSIMVRTEPNGCFLQPAILQKGVLRTNCIDCLDRTNVAQFSYGLAALGQQLHALGLIDVPQIDLDTPLADHLMSFYESMGDTLSLHYGGSAAHNTIFSERRGQWRAATQSQELFRSIQRYYSNAYVDAEKQNAINVFLGHFQPQHDKPSLWELNSDQHYDIGRRGFSDEHASSSIKRSLSDGNIVCESDIPPSSCIVGQKNLANPTLPERVFEVGDSKSLSESIPEIPTCEHNMVYSRFNPMIPHRKFFTESARGYFSQGTIGDSNFLDLDWLSSSGNSCEDEIYDRSTVLNSPTLNTPIVNAISTNPAEAIPTLRENGPSIKDDALACEISDSFVQWVIHGETIFH